MTLRQIYAGWAIGLTIGLLAVVGVLPQPFEAVGVVVILGSLVLGGADGTIPRMR